MGRTLMGDVSNGKGSRKRLGADDKKYAENYSKIFGAWPCEECGNKQIHGHKLDCSKNWRNQK